MLIRTQQRINEGKIESVVSLDELRIMSHNATGNVYVMQGIEGNRTDGVNLTNITNSTEEVNETISIFEEYFGYVK